MSRPFIGGLVFGAIVGGYVLYRYIASSACKAVEKDEYKANKTKEE